MRLARPPALGGGASHGSRGGPDARHRYRVRLVAGFTAALTTAAVLVAPHALAAPEVQAPTMPRPAAAPAPQAVAPLAAAGRMASFDAEMVSLVNSARRSAGLSPLTEAGGLTQLSVWWSTKMANGDTGYQLEHNPDAWTMVTQYGASNRTAWAENVASFPTSASASAVFNAYMNSPGHRANILGSAYHYIGMGTVSGSHGAYNTMEFTDKVDGASEPAPTTKAAPKPAPTTSAAPKPAPTTSAAPKPAPTTKAAPKPAPSTHAAPSTQAAEPPSQPARSDPEPAQQPEAKSDDSPAQQQQVAYRAPAPVAQHGRLTALTGSLPIPDLTFSIRDATCTEKISTATTGRDGSFAITAVPGSYCAVPVSLPAGFRPFAPVKFTVGSDGDVFTVRVDNLVPVTIWWRARGAGLMIPV
jgi:uncharacterized protein YkwD